MFQMIAFFELSDSYESLSLDDVALVRSHFFCITGLRISLFRPHL
jgi:hypothetical protein